MLDGEVFGTPIAATPHNLRLSRGNSQRGGDFEMWCWLVAEQLPVTLTAVDLSPATATGDAPSEGTVRLSVPAPAGGIVVTLSSSASGLTHGPPTITVAAEQSSATWGFEAGSVVGESFVVTITATLGGVILQRPLTIVDRDDTR